MTTNTLVKGITIGADDHERFFRRRIHLYLENGYGVSIVYGTGIYSRTLNGDSHGNTPPETNTAQPEATSVEVAVLKPNGDFVPFIGSGEDVRGWTDLDTVFKIVAWAAALPPVSVTA